MPEITKPIILDDTGSRIAQAIEDLAEIQTGEYTFIDGTNSFTVVPKGQEPQVVYVAPSIASISVNDVNVAPDSSSNVNISVPTAVSDLTNDLSFATESYVTTAIQNAITNAISGAY